MEIRFNDLRRFRTQIFFSWNINELLMSFRWQPSLFRQMYFYIRGKLKPKSFLKFPEFRISSRGLGILSYFLFFLSIVSGLQPPSREKRCSLRAVLWFLPARLHSWDDASTQERRHRPQPWEPHLGPQSQTNASISRWEYDTGSWAQPSTCDFSAGPEHHQWLPELQVGTHVWSSPRLTKIISGFMCRH